MNAPILKPTNPNYPSAANDLYVRGGNITAEGAPTGFYYELRKRTESVVDDEPVVSYVMLQNGNFDMTDDQWNAWTTQPTDPYVLECAAAILGLTLA